MNTAPSSRSTRALIVACRRPVFLTATIALIVLGSGCIVIPTPEFNSGAARTNINKQTALRFAPGETTRADVILALGEPDAVSPDERQLAYRSEKICGFWFVAGGYNAAGGTFEKDRYLVFDFDAQGRLEKTARSAHWFTSADVAEILPATVTDNHGLKREEVCVQSCATWFPHVNGFRQKRWALVPGSPGQFLLTRSNLVFISRSQFANAPPELAIAYPSLQECRVDKCFLGRRLVVRTPTDGFHTFMLQRTFNGAPDTKSTLAACPFIQSRLTTRSPD